MKQPDYSFTNLEPEQELLSALAPQWRARFKQALKLMDKGLEQAIEHHTPLPSWEDIAAQCAVSPHYFHRMFRLVFAEPPGQYIARQRLQWAVLLLTEELELSITDVAQLSGFSSSQALAKALRRALGYSAKQIRANRYDYDKLETLTYQLGHPKPIAQRCLEQQMAQTIEFDIQSLPDQYYFVKAMKSPGFLKTADYWQTLKRQGKQQMVSIVQLQEFDKPDHEQIHLIGYPVTSSQPANLTVKAANFLCCHVTVSTDAGYNAAWDALYEYLLHHDIEPDMNSYVVEWIHNPDTILGRGTEITLQLPIRNS
ncbi:helix-turn-helix domain-containing protein [Spartinivicinus poritis]|uniref:Helix-turn-helix domain-containing protein n=1 Tax=Spartinivicinus poritis TaxID=2994640 RepID=A0ABT5UGG5_9GAMM|nr:helix-turn-helix domain-containing protein [Spartinivicinus sp. A2-2]MDE1465407.1 helix-turn-helix domain-containing protein [Spartinivicinus sp. A2-2]